MLTVAVTEACCWCVERLDPYSALDKLLPVQYFAQNGVTACIVPLPTMEANKDFELVFELARQMEHFKLNRCASVIADSASRACTATPLPVSCWRANLVPFLTSKVPGCAGARNPS